MLSALQNVLNVYGNGSVINLHNVFFSLLVLLFSVASYAQTEEEKNIIPVSGAESLTQSHNMASRIVADKVTKNGSPVTNLSQVFLGLLFVIGLIFAMAWVLKRVSQGSFSGAQYIKLISSMPLGTRERIALIEVGGKQILLGITSAQINTLHTFDETVVDNESNQELSEFGKKMKNIMSNSRVKGDKPKNDIP